MCTRVTFYLSSLGVSKREGGGEGPETQDPPLDPPLSLWVPGRGIPEGFFTHRGRRDSPNP